jgi:beta-mannosidase
MLRIRKRKTMEQLYPRIITLLTFFSILGISNAQIADTLTGWTFKVPSHETTATHANQWLPCHVPGTIYSALYENQLIPNPLLGDNEKNVQWIEERDGYFKCLFTPSPEIFSKANIEIILKGLDTYAQVFLNGKAIAQTDNAFRTYRIDVKPWLKPGKNELLISFESAVKQGKFLAKNHQPYLPGDERVFLRKPQYQFGWDWGPRLAGFGITQPVVLEGWDQFRISDLHVQTQLNETMDTAWVQVNADVVSNSALAVPVEFFLRDNLDLDFGTTRIDQKTNVILNPGTTTISQKLVLPNPELWFPNSNYAKTYKATFAILQDTLNPISRSCIIGVRTIELDTTNGGFSFVVNKTPVFVTGANYIPESAFGPVGLFDSAKVINNRYQRFFQFNEAGVNMIRIWGGGLYADEELLDYCDMAGIMVWQDFPFACGMYPGDKSFLFSVQEEATEQVKRMRNHPSLALWCGNNENDEGWFNWGWQKQYGYSPKDSAKVYANYQLLFNSLLPGIVQNYHPSAPYVHSSPRYGWGRTKSMTEGDSHYWGVWWGMEPFEKYTQKVPRFMSEFGFQALPHLSTWKKTVSDSSLFWKSPELKAHQKHPTGYETIETYLLRDYPKPEKLEDWIYLSQLNQARGIGMALSAQRKAAPYCMGSLFWQWNDCWPVSSWSAVDYYGKPKALFEHLKTAFNDNFLVVDTQENLVKFLWTRKTPFTKNTLQDEPSFEIQLFHRDGKVLKSWSIVPNQEWFEGNEGTDFVLPILEFSLDTIEGFHKEECILYYSTMYPGCEDMIEYPSEFTFVRPKDLQLLPENIKWKVKKCRYDDCKNRFNLSITSPSFQKDVYLLDKSDRLNFMNTDQINISSSLPSFFSFQGEKVIYHGTKKEIRKIKKAIEVQTLNQFLGKNP